MKLTESVHRTRAWRWLTFKDDEKGVAFGRLLPRRKKSASRSAVVNLHVLLSLLLISAGVFFVVFATSAQIKRDPRVDRVAHARIDAGSFKTPFRPTAVPTSCPATTAYI